MKELREVAVNVVITLVAAAIAVGFIAWALDVL